MQGGNDTFTATTLTVYADLPLQGPDFSRAALDRRRRRARASTPRAGTSDRCTSASYCSTTPGTRTAPGPRPQTRRLGAHGVHRPELRRLHRRLRLRRDARSRRSSTTRTTSSRSSPAAATSASPTTARRDQPGDPGAYYPDGSRTLVRLVPSDAVQARAIVTLLRSQGVRRLYVISDTSDPLVGRRRAARRGRGRLGRDHGRPGAARSRPRRATPLSAYRAAARCRWPPRTRTPCSSPGPATPAPRRSGATCTRRCPSARLVGAEHARALAVPRIARRRRGVERDRLALPRARPVPAVRAGACSRSTAPASTRLRRSTRSTDTRRCAIVLAAIKRAGRLRARPRVVPADVPLPRRDRTGCSATSASTPNGDTSLDDLRRLPRQRVGCADPGALAAVARALLRGQRRREAPRRGPALREAVAQRERALGHRVLARGDDLRHAAVERAQGEAREPGARRGGAARGRRRERAARWSPASGAVALNAPSKRSSSSAAR